MLISLQELFQKYRPDRGVVSESSIFNALIFQSITSFACTVGKLKLENKKTFRFNQIFFIITLWTYISEHVVPCYRHIILQSCKWDFFLIFHGNASNQNLFLLKNQYWLHFRSSSGLARLITKEVQELNIKRSINSSKVRLL